MIHRRRGDSNSVCVSTFLFDAASPASGIIAFVPNKRQESTNKRQEESSVAYLSHFDAGKLDSFSIPVSVYVTRDLTLPAVEVRNVIIDKVSRNVYQKCKIVDGIVQIECISIVGVTKYYEYLMSHALVENERLREITGDIYIQQNSFRSVDTMTERRRFLFTHGIYPLAFFSGIFLVTYTSK